MCNICDNIRTANDITYVEMMLVNYDKIDCPNLRQSIAKRILDLDRIDDIQDLLSEFYEENIGDLRDL